MKILYSSMYINILEDYKKYFSIYNLIEKSYQRKFINVDNLMEGIHNISI